VDYGEDPLDACLRELKEETSLEGTNPRLINLYGDPKRDPRKHVVSAFYLVQVTQFSSLKASDDASDAKFYDVEELRQKHEELAFDHAKLLEDLVAFIAERQISI